MDTFNLQEAQRLLAELQRVHAEFEELADAGDRHRTLSADELEQCRQRLISLKAHLKQRAATGTIDGSNRRLTRLEDAFYEPAVRKASANFSLRTNAPPSQWASGLYNPSVDIAYLASQLEDMISEGV